MKKEDIQPGLKLVGVYDSRDEMEGKAPRKAGNYAVTKHATYYYTGEKWKLLTWGQYITFKVVSRHYIVGRGYITVIQNPDRLPIDRDKSAVCKGQFRLPIHGIELTLTLMTIPKPGKYWGLVTSEETIGDYVTIRMYPDEDNDINV